MLQFSQTQMVSSYLYVDCCSVIWRWWGCCITKYVAREYQGIGVEEMTVHGMLHSWRPTAFPLLGHSIGRDFLCMWLVIMLQHWCAECRHFCPSVQFDIAWLKLRMLGIESFECGGGIMGYCFNTYKTWKGTLFRALWVIEMKMTKMKHVDFFL